MNFANAGGSCRPLRDYERRTIQRNSKSLVHLLETTDDFLVRLVKNGCITKHHSCRIRESAEVTKRNETLLSILRMRSYRNLNNFKKCLKGTNQKALRKLLELGMENCISYNDYQLYQNSD